jgi:hypothetical protein
MMNMKSRLAKLSKRRLLAAGFLVCGALLVMGAARLTQEVRERPRRCFGHVQSQQDWAETVLTSVPGGEQVEWRAAAAHCPLTIIEACCRTGAGRTK